MPDLPWGKPLTGALCLTLIHCRHRSAQLCSEIPVFLASGVQFLRVHQAVFFFHVAFWEVVHTVFL